MIESLERTWGRLRRCFDRSAWTVRLFRIGRALPERSAGFSTGLVLVQIDGLGRVELQRALARGEMPFLARLLEREHYALHGLYSGLPSSTPAVQAELFYGVRNAVPGFAYLEHDGERLHRMYEPASAAAKERRLERQGQPLLSGGSAYCDIYTGGATEAHFCAASLGWSDLLKGVRPLAWAGVAALYSPTLLRAAGLTMLELLLATRDALIGMWHGYDVRAELKFVISRVGISVLLRDLITIGACSDVARGLPIVHLNYLGYDEQAHRRGPESAFAHRALRGIDQCIARLWSASHRARHRHYDLWVYADHGQEPSVPYAELTGRSLGAAVRDALRPDLPEAARRLETLDERIAGRRTDLLGGRWLQRLLSAKAPALPSARPGGEDPAPLVVAMGPVGHVYLDGLQPSPEQLQGLAGRLVDGGRIPAVLWLDGATHVCARMRCNTSTLRLPDDAAALLGSDHPHIASTVEDLIALVHHRDAGTLVLLGCAGDVPAVSFPRERGAHAGVGRHETNAFALLPADVPVPTGRALRPSDLRRCVREQRGLPERPARVGRVIAGIVGSSRGHTGPARQDLRVASYNVHACVGTDGRLAPQRIARVVAQLQADIVALQELDHRRPRSNGSHQAEMIARLLDMDFHFHPALLVGAEEYGDAVLTRLPILACRSGALPTPAGREPRGALWLTLAFGSGSVQVLNTHLGLRASERLGQVRELLSARWLAHPECVGPTILCGDLNATPGSRPLRLLGEPLQDVQGTGRGARLNTFPTRMPSVCIDHVLVRDVHDIGPTVVPRSGLVRVASDHLPMVVQLSPFAT